MDGGGRRGTFRGRCLLGQMLPLLAIVLVRGGWGNRDGWRRYKRQRLATGGVVWQLCGGGPRQADGFGVWDREKPEGVAVRSLIWWLPPLVAQLCELAFPSKEPTADGRGRLERNGRRDETHLEVLLHDAR